jgi:hypothetical protein
LSEVSELRRGVTVLSGALARWLRAGGLQLVLFMGAVTVYYAFVVSAGHLLHWPPSTLHFDQQAEGFRAGHLYTTVPPNPNLLTALHPLDAANKQWWRWDFSYYRGHLYLYWGLAPAFFLLLAKVALGVHPVEDQVLLFLFLSGRALFGQLTLFSLAKQLAPRPPRRAVWLASWVFALANPTPFLLARASVYEAALGGGSCFLVAGLYFSFEWLFTKRAAGAWRWLAAASASFGLAGTCRASLLPACAIAIGLLLLGRARGVGGAATPLPTPGLRWRALLSSLLPAGLPFTAFASAQLLMNRLRFGAWTEFGVHYQMGYGLSTGWRFVLPNVWSYLFRPLHAACSFPFLVPQFHDDPRAHLPAWLPAPTDYFPHEPLSGVLNGVPFTLLLVGGALPLFLRRARPPGLPSNEVARWRWFRRVLAATTVLSFAPVLWLRGSTMRYETDLMSGLLIACGLAGWALLALPSTRLGRHAAAALYWLTALGSIVIGVLYGFSGYFQHFEHYNPTLLHGLQRVLSVCG